MFEFEGLLEPVHPLVVDVGGNAAHSHDLPAAR